MVARAHDGACRRRRDRKYGIPIRRRRHGGTLPRSSVGDPGRDRRAVQPQPPAREMPLPAFLAAVRALRRACRALDFTRLRADQRGGRAAGPRRAPVARPLRQHGLGLGIPVGSRADPGRRPAGRSAYRETDPLNPARRWTRSPGRLRRGRRSPVVQSAPSGFTRTSLPRRAGLVPS